MSRDYLALCTPRQNAAFLAACGVDADRLEVTSATNPIERDRLVADVIAWAEANPNGQVVSLSDHPSVVHGLAARHRPDLPGLSGASLKTVLATIDKAWTRSDVVPTASNVRWQIARPDDAAPRLGSNPAAFFKPLAGCASRGVERMETGERVARPSQDSWLLPLQQLHLGDLPYDRDAVGIFEQYVDPDVPRVSVDGWIGDDGDIVPIGISDNCYAADRPEKFLYQRFPSRLTPAEQWACLELYRSVARRLVEHYGMRSQPFDVEMFVTRDVQGVPRPTVMEVNARMHPNITPILHRAFRGLDIFDWHASGPQPLTATGEGGIIWYVWSKGGAPEWSEIRRRLAPSDSQLCAWDDPGPESGDERCWGWCYFFGSDIEHLVSVAHEVFDTPETPAASA